MASGKEKAEADKNPLPTVIPDEKSIAAAISKNYGAISVLFETPSSFAILGYDAAKLTKPEAWKHIWTDFLNIPKAVVWKRAFQTFEDKGSAINDTTLSPELSSMIQKHVLNGQLLAVGNENYKNVIQRVLGIHCLYTPAVKELMWGLNIQMQRYVPKETSESTNEDRFPISKGMELFLNDRKFEVNVDMIVSKRCIEMAGVIYECDRCVDEHGDSLRLAAEDLMEVSQIDARDWDLMKLSMVLTMIWCPEDKISSARKLVPEELLDRLMKDAPLYEDKISRIPCIQIYNEIYSARKIRFEAAKVLVRLVTHAKKEYEDVSRQSRKWS